MRFDGGHGIPLKCFARFDVLLPYIDYEVILPCFLIMKLFWDIILHRTLIMTKKRCWLTYSGYDGNGEVEGPRE